MFWYYFQESLSSLFSLYIRDAGFGDEHIDAGWLCRQGIALALHSSADVLRTKDLPVVMTFLISRALVRSSLFFVTETFLVLLNVSNLNYIFLAFLPKGKRDEDWFWYGCCCCYYLFGISPDFCCLVFGQPFFSFV